MGVATKNEKLSKILEEARRNPEIKSKFLETRKAQDPMEVQFILWMNGLIGMKISLHH